MRPDRELFVVLGLLWSAPVAFGYFCAWWAQQRGRSAFGWFLFGFFLLPVAGLWLLAINGDDRDSRGEPKDKSIGRGDLLATRKDVI
ncbi:hypothetical protein [Xanthomonas sp. CFBP 8445]|uniref:hypothetical protein n=1 Tax=Xanthomonas sp. CFBP 8445 TaxID=2971236 RepID=UPI0002E0DF45|nr:hypothetical protein [Xanthomonas sp. CFBP 8445]UYC12158.1 hypothetical protein NUG21_20880 [Xanthomonas sp. CFBP 8445]